MRKGDTTLSILIVEDSSVDFRILQSALAASSHSISYERLSSGLEVVPYLSTNDVDAVWLDLDLPGRTGEQIFPEIVDSHCVYILSGLPNAYDVKQFVKKGARGIINKDASSESLETVLNEIRKEKVKFIKEEK